MRYGRSCLQKKTSLNIRLPLMVNVRKFTIHINSLETSFPGWPVETCWAVGLQLSGQPEVIVSFKAKGDGSGGAPEDFLNGST